MRRAAIAATLALALVGCGASAETVGYRFVFLAARAARIADVACATIVEAKHDRALGEKCAQAYDVTREALLTAEALLDAGRADSMICGAGKALEGLTDMEAALSSAGVDLPAELADGVRAAALATTFACNAKGGSK